jgi:hypothetical protein
MQTKKRAGRPSRELLPGERVPMSFRVTPELKATMDRLSEESGRSVTQLVETLIEQALLVERMAGTRVWRIAFDVLKAIDDATRGYQGPGEGLDDPAHYLLAMSNSIVALARHFPEEEPPDYSRDDYILAAIQVGREKIKETLLSTGKK